MARRRDNKLTGMFSSTFSCAFLVRFVLFLATRPRPGHRIAFFDLVTGGMTKQIATGIACSRKECSRKELWGRAIKLQVCSFFLIQVVRSARLLELHYQANHSWFVHPPTLRLNIRLRLQSSDPLLCLTECLAPLCLDSPLLSPRVVSTSRSLSRLSCCVIYHLLLHPPADFVDSQTSIRYLQQRFDDYGHLWGVIAKSLLTYIVEGECHKKSD
jgi:hypothetical protein